MSKPVEWFVLYNLERHPLGVVRRLKFDKKIVFRAVTWAPRSGDRELIGYYASHDGAATAIWNRYLRVRSDRHEAASRTQGSRDRMP